jgi:hypothetical protein
VRALQSPTSSPPQTFHTTLLALHSTITALLSSLSRPPQLVAQIQSTRKQVERSYNTLSRSTRWPLGLLDETRQRINEEREEKVKGKQREVIELGKELRYSQQTVAGELAGWQDLHEHMGRRAIRDFARGMVVLERNRLDGMMRALRKLQEKGPEMPTIRRMSDARAAEGAVDELASRELEDSIHETPLVVRPSAVESRVAEATQSQEPISVTPSVAAGADTSPPLPPLPTAVEKDAEQPLSEVSAITNDGEEARASTSNSARLID